jgi:hypothetical protein
MELTSSGNFEKNEVYISGNLKTAKILLLDEINLQKDTIKGSSIRTLGR